MSSFFKLRSSSEFEKMWKEFFDRCGMDSIAVDYEHITDIIFKKIVSKHLSVASADRKKHTSSTGLQ